LIKEQTTKFKPWPSKTTYSLKKILGGRSTSSVLMKILKTKMRALMIFKTTSLQKRTMVKKTFMNKLIPRLILAKVHLKSI
jgi:hypothetical protein